MKIEEQMESESSSIFRVKIGPQKYGAWFSGNLFYTYEGYSW